MHCSECHSDIPIDDMKIQAYLWETEDGHVIFICPRCVCLALRERLAKKDILLAMPSEEIKPAIRKLEID